MISYLEDLDEQICIECDECGKDHGPMVLFSPCCESDNMKAFIHEGTLTLQCAECFNDILTVAVASKGSSNGNV